MRHLLWVSMILLPVFGMAQIDSLVLEKSKAVSSTRYRDIEGSPYYFQQWVIGNVLRSDGTILKNIPLNYNCHTHEMEVNSQGNVYVLDKLWHLRAEISRDQNPGSAEDVPVEKFIFQFSPHRNIADRYVAILFQGQQLSLFHDLSITKAEKELNEFTQTTLMMRFYTSSTYYLKKGTALIPLKLHKKRILEAFDGDVRIEEFIAQEKIDPNKVPDLVKLVAFADGLE